MKIFIKKNFVLFLFLMYFMPSVSFAGDIFFDSDKNIFSKNESFLIQVYLDTKNKPVNALEGAIVFPAEYLKLKEIRDGNSSINFWVEKPSSTTDGKITFSGITTGGFSGSKRFLFGLVFETQATGKGVINFNNIQVLQNDGLGTKINTKEIPFTFSVSKELNGTTGDLSVKDVDQPEEFNPFVATDPAIFEGNNFLVFSTVDKGSGIDHYEIRESSWFFGPWGGRYLQARSPYLLKDQTLKDKIYIKAIDKTGNTRIVKLDAENKLALFLQSLIVGIISIICIVVFMFTRKKIWLKSFLK